MCVKWFTGVGSSGGMLAFVQFHSVVLVKVNEYTTLPWTTNAVDITAFHVVRDAQRGDMPRPGDQRPAVSVPGKNMESVVDRLTSADNVVLNPGYIMPRLMCGLCGLTFFFRRIGHGGDGVI